MKRVPVPFASSPLHAAKEYLDRGFRPVPIKHGTKQCVVQDWPTLQLAEWELEASFPDPSNIGILLGPSHLTDIDIDSDDVRPFVDWLPPTGAVWGRAGNPRSHYLYQGCTKPYAYKNSTGVILERRSGNQYTVAPPSTHPDGDQYIWHESGVPGEGDGLEAAGTKIAIAATLLRFWKDNVKHDLALGCAGMLLKAHWTIEEVEKFVTRIAQAANDADINDRMNAVQSTAKRMSEGEPVVGLSAIASIIGDVNTQCIKSWLNDTTPLANHAAPPKLASYAMTLANLFDLELPKIENLVEPFIGKESLNMPLLKSEWVHSGPQS